MAVLRNVVVKIGADISELQKGLQEASKQLEKTSKTLDSVGDKLTKGLTLPIVAATAGILKLGMDVDDAFDTIRVGTGATGEALANLEADFRAVYSTVPSGMADVSQAISELNTRTGLVGQPLQELTTQMLNLSRITGEELSGVIANSTRLFGDWSVAQGDTSRTMDYLFKVSQGTGIGMVDLQSKLVQFGAPLRQMGFDLETSAAMLGKFEKEGVNTELVLGGLRIALGKMAQDGITDTKTALETITQQIKDAGSTGEANALALEMFGARIGPDMAAAIREGRFELSTLVTSLQSSRETINGAATETMDFGEQLTIFKNRAAMALEPLGASLMQALNAAMPAIEGLIQKLVNVVDWFTNLGAGSQTLILSFLGIAAVIGPLISLAGQLTSGIKTTVDVVKWLADANHVTTLKTVALTVAQKASTAAQWLWNAAMSANPIGIVVVALAALGGAIVYLWNTNESFRNAMISAWEAIVSGVHQAIDGMVSLFSRVVQFFQTNWQNLLLFMIHPFSGAFSYLYQHSESFRTFIEELLASIESWFRGIFQGIQKTSSTIVSSIESTFFAIEQAIQYWIAQGMEWGRNLVQSMADGILSGVHWVTNAVSQVARSIKDFLGFSSPTKEGPGSNADEWMPNLFAMLQQGLTQEIPKINATLQTVMNPMLDSAAVGLSTERITPPKDGSSTIIIELDGRILAQHTVTHLPRLLRLKGAAT